MTLTSFKPGLEFMRSEIVFVSAPVAQLGSQISPDNSIVKERQFEDRYSVVENV